MHTGDKTLLSKHKRLSTVGYRLEGKTAYALEGGIFAAGAAIKWLRDQAGLITHARDTEAAAEALEDTGGVYMIPAFAGLGAPYWDPHARAAFVGMTLDTRKEHLIRATLEAVAYQARDLLEAFKADIAGALTPATLRIDGGMAANDWFCQFLSDLLAVPVERPRIIETTALGAAYLAGLGAGCYASTEDIAAAWQCEKRFEPQMDAAQRDALYAGWQEAVARICTT